MIHYGGLKIKHWSTKTDRPVFRLNRKLLPGCMNTASNCGWMAVRLRLVRTVLCVAMYS